METPHPKAYFNRESPKQPNDDIVPATGYAFGLMVDNYMGERRIAHNGGWVGFISTYQRFPDLLLSVISFCNTPASSTGEFWDKVANMYITAVKEAK